MADHDILIFLVLLVCLALSFLFSGMEAGVMALNHLRIRQAARGGDRRAIALQRHLNHPEDFLWTILVGNTIANFLIFSLGSLQLKDLLPDIPALWAVCFLAAVFLFYIVCELLPKSLFLRFPNRLTLMLARPFRFIHLALAPFVEVLEWFSRGLLRWTGGRIFTGQLFADREELRLLMQEAALGLTTEEKTMINRVLDLQNLRVRHVTVPFSRATTVNAQTPILEALALCREQNLSRLPVVGANKRVVGVLNMAELIFSRNLDSKKTAGEYLQPALFLNGGLLLEEALHRMQRSGGRLAIVLGPDHREVGIVSLQDILKAIFGEVTL